MSKVGQGLQPALRVERDAEDAKLTGDPSEWVPEAERYFSVRAGSLVPLYCREDVRSAAMESLFRNYQNHPEVFTSRKLRTTAFRFAFSNGMRSGWHNTARDSAKRPYRVQWKMIVSPTDPILFEARVVDPLLHTDRTDARVSLALLLDRAGATERERGIVQGRLEGLLTREIGERLGISREWTRQLEAALYVRIQELPTPHEMAKGDAVRERYALASRALTKRAAVAAEDD